MSPDISASVPPGVIREVGFDSRDGLSWRPRAGAGTYNLYRGDPRDLVDSDADGSAETYGSCLLSGLTDPLATDTALPPAGRVFFYQTTGVNEAGEGPFAPSSGGADRPNLLPCL